MKRVFLLMAVLVLSGCGNDGVADQIEAELEVSPTSDKADVEEIETPEDEVRQYSDNELDEYNLSLFNTSDRTIGYLSNMRADIYMCGKNCDERPLSDVQMSMDVSRTGVVNSANALQSLVPQIRELASSGSDNVDSEDMNRVADQFEKTANDIQSFLAKDDWATWDEPGEMIQTMIDELDEVSWLYKAYSPALSEDEGADMEAEMNISGSIVEIVYALEELQSLYNTNLSALREKPYEEGDVLISVVALYWEDTDQYIDLMTQAADLALEYEMDDALQREFEAVKVGASELQQAVADYNEHVQSYEDASGYEELVVEWEKINKSMTRIETALSVSTYQMQIYQDFTN